MYKIIQKPFRAYFMCCLFLSHYQQLSHHNENLKTQSVLADAMQMNNSCASINAEYLLNKQKGVDRRAKLY